jgi:hypothetical protein
VEVPKIENIHQRVLEAVSVPGALDMSIWHRCNTTHCRAGHVVHLAGEAGYALEKRFDTPLAASMIYRASSPHAVPMTRFFDSNDAAMADMKRLAEAEIAESVGP